MPKIRIKIMRHFECCPKMGKKKHQISVIFQYFDLLGLPLPLDLPPRWKLILRLLRWVVMVNDNNKNTSSFVDRWLTFDLLTL